MKSVAELRAEKNASAGAATEAPASDPNADQGTVAGARAAARGPSEGEERYSFTEDADETHQENYARVVLAGSEILFDEASNAKIMQMMANQKADPAVALAEVARLLVREVDQASGGTVPEEVILSPVGEFVEQAGMLANEAGLFPVDAKVIQRATQLAVGLVGDDYDVRPEDIKAFIDSIPPQELEQIRQQQEAFAG